MFSRSSIVYYENLLKYKLPPPFLSLSLSTASFLLASFLSPTTSKRDYFSSQCSALRKCLEEKKNEQPPSQCALQTLAKENRCDCFITLSPLSFSLFLSFLAHSLFKFQPRSTVRSFFAFLHPTLKADC